MKIEGEKRRGKAGEKYYRQNISITKSKTLCPTCGHDRVTTRPSGTKCSKCKTPRGEDE